MEFIAFVNYYDAATGENAREIVNVNKINFTDLVVGVTKTALT